MSYEQILIHLSKRAYKKNEVPVAALIVDLNRNKIVAKAFNGREKSNCTLDHAEIKCINEANKCMRSKFLNDCVMYVTLEPCDMCKAVLKEARIKKVYFMIPRESYKKGYRKTDFQNWDCDEIYKEKTKELLSNFFKKRR